MKYFVIISLILLGIIFLIFIYFRKKRAIKKVKCTSDEEKLSNINVILNPFGFEFNLRQDIVISKNDAWQREFGYSDLYDLNSPFFNIVMNCEPIYFDYNNKHYRLEFWKGQYGITTGAEIGIYIREYNSNLPKNFYRSATDKERLEICFHLFKNCYMFSRNDCSWWLAGFDIGKFSKPENLKMIPSIRFPNEEIRNAFIKGLLNAGYAENKINVNCLEVSFQFCCPNNYKLNKYHKIIRFFAQIFNRISCSFYMWITKPFNRSIDKLYYLRCLAPILYKFIIRKCIPKRKHKTHKKYKFTTSK